MSYYVGIIDGAEDVWGVRVPDVVGCHGGGANAEEAISDAISALSAMAAMTAADGDRLPRPRSAAAIKADPASDYRPDEGEAFVMLPLLLDKGRPARANISLDAGLLEAIDEAAKARGLTRSAFLASAARDKILAGV